MGAFNINITGVGGHGCERDAKPGDKLHKRCGRFTCPDCMAYEFVQRMRQAGMLREGEVAHSVRIEESDPIPEGAVEYVVPSDEVLLGGRKRYAQFPMKAEFTHWPGTPSAVVDDMLKNERKSGKF